MVCREEFFKFYFRILFSKNEAKRIRKLLWNEEVELKIVVDQSGASINTLSIHPVTCWSLGILDSQLVKTSFTITTDHGKSSNIERVMKVQTSTSVKIGSLRISRCDVFNLFGPDLVKNVAVDNITPNFKFHETPIPISEDAKLSLMRQPSVAKNIRLEKHHLKQILKSANVFYKNDVIRITNYNAYTDKTTHLFYKLDVSSSPCIMDSSTAVYETSAVSQSLPFSNFLLKNSLTSSMRTTVFRMTQIYSAQKTISKKALVLLVTGASGSGKRLMSRVFASETHRNFFEVDGYEMVCENASTSEAKWTSWWEKAKLLQNCVLFIRNSNVLAIDQFNALDRRILQYMEQKLSEPSKITVIFSCNTDTMSSMPANVKNLALYTFSAEFMDENDRKTWLQYYLNEKLANHVAKKTSGFTLAELEKLVKNGKKVKIEEKEEKVYEDLIDKRNSNFADAIGAPKIPNVRWEDVGGLEETKQTVLESIRTNLFGSRALKRSGIILYGSPGCGKTLIAKAVATEFKIAFLSVKGPELLNKYVGQSEENLRKVFERAKQASPCVIFFDEIDSLAPNRGRNGDSGGVIDRIVSQLLAELDKLHNSPLTKVFVMGATNRPDLLDNSLMTPGRFDKLVEVKPGEDVESKTKILEAVSRKMRFEEDVDLREIASKVDEKMSGAQLFSIISNAGMAAIVETIQSIEDGKTENQSIRVAQRHLLESVKRFHETKY
ncbi:Peroxisomal ATPase PEX1 [Caenorhabditis elegans]|uniref:Peroxisomal ATPase PEX1 n=1 Tax=Caenorhabditis elegans TaxID=6239 RepID=G5EFR8_CAEEL|nr:AAA+ ATPase domain-containing protein [Caenorhabditis elegans]BAA33544.1 PEX6 [Caenorhabditis elegans]BAA76440.1 Pex6p homolog [Caenorhabditis elegans]CCD65247.1 AAA+ ATPase domain-containing protein [Caenorhabditis elegans]|eukprot:NP_504268.1 PeRoXisome assembly factor [Caenorhabditis elegans]